MRRQRLVSLDYEEHHWEFCILHQCFSTAGPRPGTGPWHQLSRAARGLRKL